MSTNDRKAKAQAAARGTGGGANVIVVAGIVAVLAIALVVGGVIWASRDGGGSGGGASQLPDGVTKGEPIEPFASAKPAEDAPVVDVYEDFRCPICRTFESSMGDSINELAKDGKIRLRVHLKTVIDTNTGGDSSAVAGSSAVCAADQGKWEEYHQALFALQPEEETREGFPTSDYTKAAKEAGLSGDAMSSWQQCTDKETYVDYVQSVDDQSVKDGITGTPVIEVEGTQLNWGSLLDQGSMTADTQRLEEILTSGKVPQDLVATP
ncbi:DsbA family protein [Janibacter sp. CX7]|uniref:DsbA family protein n=1 Tax=unclassified Janibacter TaxID=2649294 RepID=UPI0020CB7878|nr:thioredoxin domain-containing protein [Janibacter sp. CX7]UTT64812.1 DsbA family protein [Janibacter sp. CX7]